jgi:maleylacetoacetate isomerase
VQPEVNALTATVGRGLRSARMVLYDYAQSSSAWRVRWALALKGVNHRTQPVDLRAGAHHSAEYAKLNPMNAVPALVLDGGEVLTESVAIIEWLEETYPSPPLMPRAPLDRARVRELVQVINAGTQPLQNLMVRKAHSADAAEQQAWARRWSARGLQAYERLASRWSGRFSLGDALTLADLYLVPQCRNAEQQGVPLAETPRAAAIYRACLDLPEAKATHPDAPNP